ncbi:MAG: hypothetical protein MAG551_02335 [Candidatus Scalindua arabica]|uniref:DUF2442 domain-containing protein n=1 Tax=Candidatus Scalindua arabica TaxID=1127984 RepID=A0A941W5N2_9BACT|nr:hypothetical protein [Candidatus Scalindua arabica]
MILDEQVITIISAEYVGEYKIKLSFNDNTIQLVDLFPFLNSSLNPLIRKYLDKQEFRKFKIDNGDLEWNDYDLCFPIADLYENNIKP